MTSLPNLRPIPPGVAQVFDQFSPSDRSTLLEARALILAAATKDARIGDVEETLKWGEPAYLPVAKGIGSTVRLGVDTASRRPAMFFNCKTTIVEDMREHFGPELAVSKNRAVFLDAENETTQTALEFGIGLALTYHLQKKRPTT